MARNFKNDSSGTVKRPSFKEASIYGPPTSLSGQTDDSPNAPHNFTIPNA